MPFYMRIKGDSEKAEDLKIIFSHYMVFVPRENWKGNVPILLSFTCQKPSIEYGETGLFYLL